MASRLFLREAMETRLKTQTIVLLLIFVVLGLYYPAIFAPLGCLDDPGMRDSLLNTDTFSLRSIFFPGGSGSYYRPLLSLSFFWDKYVWGLEESFMHLENVLLHLFNTLLVFGITLRVGRLLKISSPLPVFLAPLFFAIHPINTESVNWISGRTDLLAGFFILLSAFLLIGETKSKIATLGAAFSLLIACLAKETAVFFLPAALVLPFFSPPCITSKCTLRATFVENIPHILIFTFTGACYFVFRKLAFWQSDFGIGQVATRVAGVQGPGFLISLRLLLKAAGFYVKKLFIPFPLNLAIIHVSDLYIIVGVLLCILILLLLTRRTLSGFFFLSAASLGASALLVPLIAMTWTPLAERYMYIPSAFFLVGLTFVVYQWEWRIHRQRIMVLAIASVAAIALVGTAQRNFLWQDNLALLEDCLRKSPGFVPAQNQLATVLYSNGKISEGNALIKSMKSPEDLINFQYGLISKSAALINVGDDVGARKILRQALANPGRHEAKIIERLLKLNNKEVLEGKTAQEKLYPENVELLSRIYAITGDTFYLYRLGQTHLFNNNRAKARLAFQRVVALAPENVYYYKASEKLLTKLL